MNAETFRRLAELVPINNVGWFDVIDRSGAMQRWLESGNADEFSYGIQLLSQPALLTERGGRIAILLRSALERQGYDEKTLEERRNRMLQVFSFTFYAESPDMWRLFMDLFAQGCFEKAHENWWYQFHDLPEKNPSAAVELLAGIFDRCVARGSDEHSEFGININRVGLGDDFVTRTAQGAAEEFVKSMLPRVVALIKANEFTDELGCVSDRVWPWLTFGFHRDLKSSLLHGLSKALGRLAKTAPEKHYEYISGLEHLPHRNIAFLLLTSWSENPVRFADRSIDYLLADRRRMAIGYGMWGTGNGIAAITRATIGAASPYCSEEALRRLESAILVFYPPVERTEARRLGYAQLLLLHAVDSKRINRDAKARLEQLTRKFPHVDLSRPRGSAVEFSCVQSPIPEKAALKMTDAQWISAMRKYRETEVYGKTGHKPGLGGTFELAKQLELHARVNRARFARLALKLNEDIPSIYFDALLRALTAKRQDSGGSDQAELPKLDSETLIPVLRHAHELPNHPCARWLCSAIGDIAERELPDDILDIVSFYAIQGEEPEGDDQGEKNYFGGDLVNYGINTSRGAAAQALADLLFANAQRWPKLEKGIISVVHSRSWSIRAVAISCLIALLNVDRSLAVDLFLVIAKESPPVLGSMFVDQFLYHATRSHYLLLRGTLLRMITDNDRDIRETAARAICIASVRVAEGEQDLRAVVGGDEVCRATLAVCAAENLQFPEMSDRCRVWLMAAFKDESKKVREAASRCFRAIPDEQLCSERLLIDSFIDSPAFQDNVQSLLLALDKAVHRMPDVVCRIPEKAVAIHRQQESGEAMDARWWTQQMANFVLRLYDQTRDAKIRTRCLDVLDSMIELGFGDVIDELGKLDRGY